jgi:protein SCO1/2
MLLKKTIATLLCCLLLTACSEPVPWNGRDVSGVFPDLQFELLNSDGHEINAGAYRGKTTLMYFGFTNCPGVCPATLGQISVALNELGTEAENIHVLLVSVDPERDTPEAMKVYTERFGPWLHGLTGPEQDLRKLNNAYKVDFLAQQADEKGDYEVAHSNRVFAFDPQGRCKLLLGNTANTPALVSDLRRLVEESGQD